VTVLGPIEPKPYPDTMLDTRIIVWLLAKGLVIS